MSDDLRQSQTKWVDATRDLRESEDKVKKKEDRYVRSLSLSLVCLLIDINAHIVRIKDLIDSNRKLEEKIADLNSQMMNSIETNKHLIDEHQALQTLYNAHERKLKESQSENDQIVSTASLTLSNYVHVCFLYRLYILLF